MAEKIKTAFILGAGLGTRLRPLTATWPKPLLPIQGQPMICHAFDRLHALGVERIIINTHHCPARYEETFPSRSWRGMSLLFVHEPVLLDTGGGLKNIEPLIVGEPILVHNGDIVTTLPLQPLLETHFKQGHEATLALRSTGEPLNVGVLENEQVCDMRNTLKTPAAAQRLFTGIYVIRPAFLRRIPKDQVISVIPAFLELIQEKNGLGGVLLDSGEWSDVGTLEVYQRLNQKSSPHADVGLRIGE